MWRKDGVIYQRGGIVIDGKRYWNPTPEQFEADGWQRIAEEPKFAEVKAAFWGYVDEAAEALSRATGQTYARADFPTGAYSPELLTWCAEHGMDEATTGALAVKFCGIAADLARLGRNWEELFEGSGNTEPSESEGLTDND